MAFGIPLASSVVPSTGSTAMSIAGPEPVAHLLAVVEHRGLVLLAFPDHHHAAHRHARDHVPHGVDGRAVAALLVAPPRPPTGGQRRRLGDPHQVQPEVAIGELVADPLGHAIS